MVCQHLSIRAVTSHSINTHFNVFKRKMSLAFVPFLAPSFSSPHFSPSDYSRNKSWLGALSSLGSAALLTQKITDKCHRAFHHSHIQHFSSLNMSASGPTVSTSATTQTNQGESFDWSSQWYPAYVLDFLDSNVPTKITILNMDLVIFYYNPPSNPSKAGWKILLDMCPHRLAALSEGRIEPSTGNIMCSYHGWQFNGQGSCEKIPQMDHSNKETAANSNMPCAIPFHTMERQGILWVWMNPFELPSPDTPLPGSPDAEDVDVIMTMRDVSYGYDVLLENVADPSHVPFAHHGIQGNRAKARPMPMSAIEPLSRRGFKANLTSTAFTKSKSFLTFDAPCRLQYLIQRDRDKKFILLTYCVPISPGRSRLFGIFGTNSQPFKTVFALRPIWWDHFERNAILDGDMVFLESVDHHLEKTGRNNYATMYKMPTSADFCVIQTRKWFQKYAGNEIGWIKPLIAPQDMPYSPPPFPAQISTKQQAMDRVSQHLRYCRPCRIAHARFKFLVKLLYFISMALVATAAVVKNVSTSSVMAITSVTLILVAEFIKKVIIKRFEYTGYDHARR